MALISLALKRGWLSWCYDNDTGSDLLAALKAQRDARASQIQTGQLTAASSANNHSVSFSAPNQSGFRPQDLLEFWQEMVELFESRYAALGGTPDDDDVYAEMLFSLGSARSVSTSFTNLRFQ